MKKIFFFVLVMTSFYFSHTQSYYNPEKAVRYAQRWWNDRNTNPADSAEWKGPYIDYTSDGGDCAAFVSQCLIFGGLDLSAGTNGSGAYVKKDNVISGAEQLIQHLKRYQNTTYSTVTGWNPPSDHDVGDPMFILNINVNTGFHSFFCSSLNNNATQLHSAHTRDTYNANTTNYWPQNDRTYFHIKNSIPVHCTNCIQDEDETDIDCGGSCPPCQHAPGHKSYTTNTSPANPLPSETYAINSITAGNASVKVYSGQNVSFYSAGAINLKDGFHAESGSNFFAQPKSMRLHATADCQAFCDPVRYNTCTREPGNPNGYNDTWYWEITNAKSVSVVLDQYDGFNHSVIMDVYSNTFVPSQDGEVMLWNLEDGTPCYESSCKVSGSVNGNCTTDHHLFYYHVTILSCQDIPFEYTGSLFVLNTVCTKKLLSPSVNSAERNDNMQAIFNQDELEYVSSIEKELIVQNNDLQVYPNPAKDQITVSYKFSGDSYAEIIIHDVSGKELMKKSLTDEHNRNLISIDISSFTNGIYFLTLQSKTSSQRTKFIVLRP